MLTSVDQAYDKDNGTPFRFRPAMSYAHDYCLDPYMQAFRQCMFATGRKG